MPLDYTPLLRPSGCAVVVFECQEGVVGEASTLPGLAAAVSTGRVIDRIADLIEGAHRAHVRVIHATMRPGDGVAPRRGPTPLEHRLRRDDADRATAALDMGPVVERLAPGPRDVVIERHDGLTGFHRSGLDAALQDAGARTVVLVGVSLNVGIPGTAIEAVNHGYAVVVPPDCVAADPPEYAPAVLRHSLRQVAFLVESSDILATWAT